MSLSSSIGNEIALTPRSGRGQALTLSPFDKAQGRRWNGRGNLGCHLILARFTLGSLHSVVAGLRLIKYFGTVPVS